MEVATTSLASTLSTAKRADMNSLPRELLIMIIRFTQLDRGSLNTLSQANKQLHFMINPILYSFIDLRGEEAVQCLDRTLRKWINPWTVKSLEKDGIWKGREKTLIERIKILLLTSTHAKRKYPPLDLPSTLLPVISRFKNLKQLALVNCSFDQNIVAELLGPDSRLRSQLESLQIVTWDDRTLIDYLFCAPAFVGLRGVELNVDNAPKFLVESWEKIVELHDPIYFDEWPKHFDKLLQQAAHDIDIYKSLYFLYPDVDEQIQEGFHRIDIESNFSRLAVLNITLNSDSATDTLRSLFQTNIISKVKSITLRLLSSCRSKTPDCFSISEFDWNYMRYAAIYGITLSGNNDGSVITEPLTAEERIKFLEETTLETPIPYCGPTLRRLTFVNKCCLHVV